MSLNNFILKRSFKNFKLDFCKSRKSVLNIHWKDWCWSWNSNTLATWCEGLTPWKRPWCWERLKAGGEGNDRGWDGWMASPTQWTWIWVNSGSWGWTGSPGMLQSIGSQRVGHDWANELNWTERQQGFYLIFLDSQCLQFSSVTQFCPTLCDPMNCSTPDLPVCHQLPEFT